MADCDRFPFCLCPFSFCPTQERAWARQQLPPTRSRNKNEAAAELKRQLARGMRFVFSSLQRGGGPAHHAPHEAWGAGAFHSARASEDRADLAREWSPAVAPGSMPRLRRLCAGRLPADFPRGLNMVGAVFRLQYATCVRAPVSLRYSAGAFSFRARGVSLHGPRCV